MDSEAVTRRRIVEASTEGADDEVLRRARIDVLFTPSAAFEEVAAAAERDPSFLNCVLTTHNRIALRAT